MLWIVAALYLTTAFPIIYAWRFNRSATLVHATNWAAAAWLSWLAVTIPNVGIESMAGKYLALCLTSCASIAVLGARRPIAAAWNFVVLGLLVVLLLPLTESLVLGTPLLEPLRLIFVSATILVGVLNYVPTRFVMSAFLIGTACGLELFSLTQDMNLGMAPSLIGPLLLVLACWDALLTTWLANRLRSVRSEFDREWLSFRDAYGLLWSQRVREQFNRAAANAGWTVYLRWGGLRKTSRDMKPSPEQETQILSTLRGILQRFTPRAD